METFTPFLIIFSFGCMVVTGGVTILYIRVCREIDALKLEAKDNKERTKFHSSFVNQQDTEIDRLRLENARLGSDLSTIRNYVQRLRVKAGEITPDGRLIPRNRKAWLQP